MGMFSTSYKIVKSGFTMVKRDKKFLMPYIVAFAAGAAMIGSAIAGLYATDQINIVTESSEAASEFSFEFASPIAIAVMAVTFIAFRFIVHIAEAYVVKAALTKYRGERVVWAEVSKAVRNRLSDIVKFSALSASLGLILSFLEEHLPFAGQISASLVQGAWSIASAFSIPVIVDSAEPIGPVAATRKSVKVISKQFGENVKVSFATGLVMLPIFIVWFIASAVAMTTPVLLSANASSINPAGFILPGIGVALSGTVVFALSSVITGVTRAALFHYAQTGNTPEVFEKEVFKAAITPKEARGLFS